MADIVLTWLLAVLTVGTAFLGISRMSKTGDAPPAHAPGMVRAFDRRVVRWAWYFIATHVFVVGGALLVASVGELVGLWDLPGRGWLGRGLYGGTLFVGMALGAVRWASKK